MRVVPAFLDVEAGGAEHAATGERKRGERSDIARRAEPENKRRRSRWERAQPVEHNVERCCSTRDGRYELQRRRGPFLLDRSKEVNCQMERLRARPANIWKLLPELTLDLLRRPKPWVGERNGEEAPHPAGVAVGVALRLGLVGEGLGRAAAHGLPPALVSETSIWLAAQS